MEPTSLTPMLVHFGVEQKVQRFSMLDLFAGAGGMSLGLSWAGFSPIAAVESDPATASTYDANFGNHVLRHNNGKPYEMEDINFSQFNGQVDLLAGGPPCQGFSLLGTRLQRDPRNHLWREYMRAVEQIRPRSFVMENVPPILRSGEGRATVEYAQRLGYDVTVGVLSAEHFGVPQKRKRAFFIGVLEGAATLPRPIQLSTPRTVRWAFRGLAVKPDNINWHIGRNPTEKSLERYRTIPEGGNRFDLMTARPDITPDCWLRKKSGSTDVFGRLWWDRPALTVRTEFYKPEKGRYLHPSEHRPITHREAARLQTFPDDFSFQGSKTEVAVQIGNAVPPVLSFWLGNHVGSLLTGNFSMPKPSQTPLFAAE